MAVSGGATPNTSAKGTLRPNAARQTPGGRSCGRSRRKLGRDGDGRRLSLAALRSARSPSCGARLRPTPGAGNLSERLSERWEEECSEGAGPRGFLTAESRQPGNRHQDATAPARRRHARKDDPADGFESGRVSLGTLGVKRRSQRRLSRSRHAFTAKEREQARRDKSCVEVHERTRFVQIPAEQHVQGRGYRQ